MNNESNYSLILPKKYSLLIFCSCQQGLLYVYQYYNIQNYNMMIVSLCLYLSSISFWMKPIYGIRRTIDRFCVQSVSAYTFYCAYDCHMEYLYLKFNFFCLMGFLIYIYGCHLYNKKHLLIYTICHIILHTCGGLGNAVFIECLEHSENNEHNIVQLQNSITLFYMLFFGNYIIWFCF